MTPVIMLQKEDWIRHETQEDDSFGAIKTEQGFLPLRALDVRTEITGLVARTTLRQTFVNTYDQPLEATYIFPLPSRAAVTHFAMEVNGRVVEGQLKERGEARAQYNEAIAQGKRAAIAEQERSDVFTIRAGNLARNDVAVVELVMIAPLDVVEGEVTWRFPLVVAPKYIPGKPISGQNVGSGVANDTTDVPDASRISPPVRLGGYPNPVRLSIHVDIDSGGHTLGQIRSSLHAVDMLKSSTKASIRVHPGEFIDRDFILRFDLAGKDVSHGALSQADPTQEGRHVFQLSLVAPKHLAVSTQPREVVFLLDHSGSMGGWKMVAARRAVARILDTLTPSDKFLFLGFSSQMTTIPQFGMNMTTATNRNRYRAMEHIAKVTASGGTEMARPLEHAAQMLHASASQSQASTRQTIVLITDGQVGNEAQIIRQLQPFMGNITVFTVGIDRAVNEGFLSRLAENGGGRFELVESEDRLDEAMDRIHRLVDSPVLTDIRIGGGDIRLEASSIAPAKMPDLFAGTPLVLSGRMYPVSVANPTIEIQGKTADGEAWQARVPVVQSNASGLAPLWARMRLLQLEDDYVVYKDPGLAKAMTSLSLAYRVLCRFTSFVAVDHEESIDQSSPLRQVTQAVDAPSGWQGNAGKRKRQVSARAKTMPAPGHARMDVMGGMPPAPAPMSAPMPAPSMEVFAEAEEAFDQFGSIDALPMEQDLMSSSIDLSLLDSMAPPAPQRAPAGLSAGRRMTQAGGLQDSKNGYVYNFESLNKQPLSAQTHLFLLGCMLYKLLTGRSLFRGTGIEHVSAIMNLDVPQPLFLPEDGDFAPKTKKIILRAIGKMTPFAHEMEMSKALRQLIGSWPVMTIGEQYPDYAESGAPVLLGYKAMKRIQDMVAFEQWLVQDMQGRWAIATCLAPVAVDDAFADAMRLPKDAMMVDYTPLSGYATLLAHGSLPDGRMCVIRKASPVMSLSMAARTIYDATQIAAAVCDCAQILHTLSSNKMIDLWVVPETIMLTGTGDVVFTNPVLSPLLSSLEQASLGGVINKVKSLFQKSSKPKRDDFWK